MSQWAIAEYRCDAHGVFEELLERPTPDTHRCPECSAWSPWTMSAPKPKILSVPCYAAVKGGDTERRPGMLDTRPLADGMKYEDWKKAQEPARQERRHHELIAKGFKNKRIQV